MGAADTWERLYRPPPSPLHTLTNTRIEELRLAVGNRRQPSASRVTAFEQGLLHGLRADRPVDRVQTHQHASAHTMTTRTSSKTARTNTPAQKQHAPTRQHKNSTRQHASTKTARANTPAQTQHAPTRQRTHPITARANTPAQTPHDLALDFASHGMAVSAHRAGD